jgi:hypothetical protein
MVDDQFQFSDYTVSGLEAIPEVRPMIRRLRQICALVAVTPDTTAAGTRKNELKHLHKRLIELSGAMDDLSADTYVDLIRACEEFEEVSRPKFRFSDLNRLRRETAMLSMVIPKALESLPKERVPPKKQKHDLAIYVAVSFRLKGFEPTTHENGLYMSVLELLFAELFGDDGEYQHLRHGKWACSEIKKL